MARPTVALLTGANGFIGSALVRRLLADGAQVRALTSGRGVPRLGADRERVTWFPFDAGGIAQAVEGVTHFFNFAVLYDRPSCSDAAIDEINVEQPLRILEALAASGREVTCVMGDSFYRKYPPEATSQARYTRSKNLLAQRLRAACGNSRQHRCAMLLIEQVYGPGESLQKAYPRVIGQLLAHEPRVRLTPGDQRRDFIHLSDVVDAAMTAAHGEWRGVVDVECGSAGSTPVRTVFERLKELAASRSTLGFGDLAHDQSIPDSAADTTWLQQRGWTCRIPLDTGLREMVDDVARRLDAGKEAP